MEKIVREIKEVGVFSLQADETKDLAKVKQPSLCLRYVKDDQIKERFIKLTACSDLTALSLCDTGRICFSTISLQTVVFDYMIIFVS